jgi:hypothetical protein
LGLGGGHGQRDPRRGCLPLGAGCDDEPAAPRIRLVAWRGWAGDVGQHDAVSPVVFSWVFAAHQLGAAIAAAGAGWLRDLQGNYDMAFYLGAALCFVAAVLSAMVRRNQVSVTSTRSAPASRS